MDPRYLYYVSTTSSQVVLIQVIWNQLWETLLWSTGSQIQLETSGLLLSPGEYAKWSLLGSHPWVFWLNCSEEEDRIMSTGQKNWMEKQNRHSLACAHEGEFLVNLKSVDHLRQKHPLCLLHVDLYLSGHSGHNFWWKMWNLFIWKAPQVRLQVFLPFLSSNHWSSSKQEHDSILQIVSKFENAAVGLVKTIWTELSFLTPWGVIHEVSIWILRKVSIEMLLVTWVMCELPCLVWKDTSIFHKSLLGVY